MTGAPRTPKGVPKGTNKTTSKVGEPTDSSSQIEYLLYQSTQGFHFIFDNSDIVRVMSEPTNEKEFFTQENMKKVQGLLTNFLDCPSLEEKRSFLDRLPGEDFELLVRAYFQLVDNTILACSDLRH
jgi:hypothetical protein